jgi:hypothetical protein
MVTVGGEPEGTWEKLSVVVKCTNASYVQQFITKLYDYYFKVICGLRLWNKVLEGKHVSEATPTALWM